MIEPILLVFIEPKDLNRKDLKRWQTREELYFNNDLYSKFLLEELAPYIEKNYPASKNRSIVGLSFGGLSAAYTAISNPTAFENVILQSPAFHTRKKIYELYKNTPKQDFKIYINYGNGNDTERQDVPFIDILKEKEYDLTVKIVPNGDHNWKTWEPQLNDILIQYFGVENNEVKHNKN